MRGISISVNAYNDGKRVDNVCKQMTSLTYSEIMLHLRKKRIWVNGKTVKHNVTVRRNDTICFALFLEKFIRKDVLDYYSKKNAENSKWITVEQKERKTRQKKKRLSLPLKMQVLFQNSDFLCLDKKQDQAVFGKNSIAELLQHAQEPDDPLDFKPSPCHRLDRNTSGILLCAVSLNAARELHFLQTEACLSKLYFTVLELEKHWDHSRIQHTIQRSHALYRTQNNCTIALPVNSRYGKTTVGKDLRFLGTGVIRLTALFPLLSRSLWCFAAQIMGTGGKTHQIRSQCMSLDMPLFGDRKYQSRNADDNYTVFSRSKSYFLHAAIVVNSFKFENHTKKEGEFPNSRLKIERFSFPKSLYSNIPENWYNFFQHKRDRKNFDAINASMKKLCSEIQSFEGFFLEREDRIDLIDIFNSIFGSPRG